MGLQDRDYMHERRERPFKPPNEGTAPTWLIVVLVTLVGYGLYQAYERWWLPRASFSEAQHRGAVQQPAPAPAVPDRPSAPSVPPAGWTRCEIDGRVLYTDGPCPGAQLAARSPTAPTQSAASARTITLYHCKGYDGGAFWANSHCNQHQALVDRMVNVPASLPFEQQVAIANGQRMTAQALAIQPAVPASQPSSGGDSKAWQCKALDERVRYLDGLARQPQSGAMQDWIRSERLQARDRQFRLRC